MEPHFLLFPLPGPVPLPSFLGEKHIYAYLVEVENPVPIPYVTLLAHTCSIVGELPGGALIHL